jgi:hypothetical protein
MALVEVMQGGIGVAVLIVLIFAVTLVIVNQYVYGTGASSANLSGAALTLAQQTPLMTVLAFVFVPIAAFAIYSLRMVG